MKTEDTPKDANVLPFPPGGRKSQPVNPIDWTEQGYGMPPTFTFTDKGDKQLWPDCPLFTDLPLPTFSAGLDAPPTTEPGSTIVCSAEDAARWFDNGHRPGPFSQWIIHGDLEG